MPETENERRDGTRDEQILVADRSGVDPRDQDTAEEQFLHHPGDEPETERHHCSRSENGLLPEKSQHENVR